jgi:hypothetical protein
MPQSNHRSRSIERPASGARGQVLVIFVGGLLAIIALAAVVIDLGNLWAQQRDTQNASDAAAEAGAIIMAQRLAGAPVPTGGWDAAVKDEVDKFITANEIELAGAYYTDICGIPLKPDGTAALTADGTQNFAVAAEVGGGIPTSSATMPDCPNSVVGPPAGVIVVGRKTVDTYLARAIGVPTLTPVTQATAVAGWLSSYEIQTLFPVTFPVNIVTCDQQNRPVNTGVPWDDYTVYRVPLCQNGPGNVGWIDWDPPNGGIPDVIDSIYSPDNPPVRLPSWQFVTQTGNVNSAPLENALNDFAGQVVMIPLFDLTCDATPNNDEPYVSTPTLYGCPAGSLGGNGQQQWYRFPAFAAFELCDPSLGYCGGLTGAYLTGNDRAVCDTGNGATSCLVGRFVDFITTGTVEAGGGGGSSPTKVVGVQLIR